MIRIILAGNLAGTTVVVVWRTEFESRRAPDYFSNVKPPVSSRVLFFNLPMLAMLR